MKLLLTILVVLFCYVGYGQIDTGTLGRLIRGEIVIVPDTTILRSFDNGGSVIVDTFSISTKSSHDHRWCNRDSLYHAGWEMYAGSGTIYFYRNPEHLISVRKKFINKHK